LGLISGLPCTKIPVRCILLFQNVYSCVSSISRLIRRLLEGSRNPEAVSPHYIFLSMSVH
jgi:hypothetical protein